MKRGTPDHPKTIEFAESLRAFLVSQSIPLPFDLAKLLACGILETLWHYTARYAPAGDIGKFTDAQIARAIGWAHDAQWLVENLRKCRWLDDLKSARIFVHDWQDHSDDAADKWLWDKGLRYANGSDTRRGHGAPRKPKRRGSTKSRPSRDKSSQSDPSSNPDPSSSSNPESNPNPSWPAALERPDCRTAWQHWINYKRDRGERYKSAATASEQLERLAKWGPDRMVAAIKLSIAQAWMGIFEDDKDAKRNGNTASPARDKKPGPASF